MSRDVSSVVLVTGAAQGIGKAIAQTFAHRGARVWMGDLDEDVVKQAAATIGPCRNEPRPIRMDVRDREQVEAAVGTILEEHGRIDVLVNNAGTSSYQGFLDLDYENWINTIDVNLTGTFLVSQRVAREMAKEKRGAIVNMASVDASRPEGHCSHYVASKGGVIALTRAMAVDLASYGIRVNAVAPGPIMTEPIDAYLSGGAGAKGLSASLVHEFVRSKMSNTLLGRPGRAEEVASVVYFLASAEASFVTGETLFVDGGQRWWR